MQTQPTKCVNNSHSHSSLRWFKVISLGRGTGQGLMIKMDDINLEFELHQSKYHHPHRQLRGKQEPTEETSRHIYYFLLFTYLIFKPNFCFIFLCNQADYFITGCPQNLENLAKLFSNSETYCEYFLKTTEHG